MEFDGVYWDTSFNPTWFHESPNFGQKWNNYAKTWSIKFIKPGIF